MVKASSVTNTSNIEDKDKKTIKQKKPNPIEDGALIGRKT